MYAIRSYYVEGSWENEFQYKNFTFSFLLDMRFGGNVASFPARYGTAYGVLETSLNGGETTDEYLSDRGVSWVSKYSGDQYEDGVIPVGVFASGTIITGPDRITSYNVCYTKLLRVPIDSCPARGY